MLNSLKQTNEIFVVDDDHAVRDALTMALRGEGYVVESFGKASSLPGCDSHAITLQPLCLM